MVLTLRRALKTDEVEIPDHFEGVPLRKIYRSLGWCVGIFAAAAGIAVMVLWSGTHVEAAGAVTAALGAMILFCVIRCRRIEISVGARWFQLTAGPLRRRVPRNMVTASTIRSAEGWRKLYADREIRLQVGNDSFIFPSREPDDVLSSLEPG